MPETTSTMARDERETTPSSNEAGFVLIYATGYTTMPRGFLLSGHTHAIGREPAAGGICIAQTAVSRMHAVVHCDRGEVRLKDLDSRNGTYVNGERASAAVLHDGDDVRIGDALFKFVSHDARGHLAYDLDGSRARDAAPVTIDGAVGGLSMARLSAEVEASAKAGTSVLVLGETGVGKELVARASHVASRRSGPFVAVNCAALSPNLVESELFGHKKGAFTGAAREHEGLIRSAEGGTIFLDEIGDLPLESQAKLLRVLESREVLAVGETRSRAVDVHVVCATHRDVAGMTQPGGRFRADLLARIAGYVLRVPPLRARKEDLFFLVRHFLRLAGAREAAVTFPFMAQLCRMDWPLNVRELGNAVRHAVARANDGELRSVHLPAPTARAAEASAAAPAARRKGPSEDAFVELLRRHEGNISAVARELRRDAAQVYRWLKRFDIDPETFRPK